MLELSVKSTPLVGAGFNVDLVHIATNKYLANKRSIDDGRYFVFIFRPAG